MPAAKPPESQRRAFDLVARGEPVARNAKDLGISQSCLPRWMKRDAADSRRKVCLTSTERMQFVELRCRSRVLEMEIEIEIEILKRASAYVAGESMLPKQRSGWSRSWPRAGSPAR